MGLAEANHILSISLITSVIALGLYTAAAVTWDAYWSRRRHLSNVRQSLWERHAVLVHALEPAGVAHNLLRHTRLRQLLNGSQMAGVQRGQSKTVSLVRSGKKFIVNTRDMS